MSAGAIVVIVAIGFFVLAALAIGLAIFFTVGKKKETTKETTKPATPGKIADGEWSLETKTPSDPSPEIKAKGHPREKNKDQTHPWSHLHELRKGTTLIGIVVADADYTAANNRVPTVVDIMKKVYAAFKHHGEFTTLSKGDTPWFAVYLHRIGTGGGGYASSGAAYVNIAPDKIQPFANAWEKQEFIRVLLHELGHCFDDYMMKKVGNVKADGVSTDWTKNIENITKNKEAMKLIYNEYCENGVCSGVGDDYEYREDGPWENFAGAFSKYFCSGGRRRMKASDVFNYDLVNASFEPVDIYDGNDDKCQ